MKWDIFYTIIVSTWLTAQVTFTECLDIDENMYSYANTHSLLACLSFENESDVIWEKIMKDGDTELVDTILQYFSDLNVIDYGTNYKGKTEQYKIAKDKQGKNSMLMIRPVKALDAGYYQCRIRPVGDVAKHTVQLFVLVPPTKHKIHLNVGSFIANAEKEVRCRVENISPGKANTRIVIKSGGKPLATSTIEDLSETENSDGTYNLTYTPKINLTKDHNGRKLKCQITWMNNTDYNVTVFISTNSDINVYFPPTNVSVERKTKFKVNEDTEVTITCSTDGGNPLPTLSLHHDYENGTFLSLSQNVTSNSHDFKLTVKKQNNKVKVICKAVSSEESKLQYNIKSSGSVKHHVQFMATSAEITNKPTTLIEEDNHLSLTCLSNEGVPNPTLLFYTNEKIGQISAQQNISGSFQANYASKVFTIQNVKRTMNTKDIECILDGTNIKDSYRIGVRFQPDGVKVNKVKTVKVGEIAQITCTANSASPVTDVAMRLHLGDTLRLQYNSSNSSDVGVYTGHKGVFNFDFKAKKNYHNSNIICIALWNGIPVTENTETMQVYFPPDTQIVNPPPAIEGKQFVLECRTTKDGNPIEITKYVWKFKPNDSQEYIDLPSHIKAVRRSNRLIIEKATYKAAGSYQCTVYNKGGNASNETDLIVYYSAKPINTSRLFYGEIGKAATITFYFKLRPYKNDVVKVNWIFRNGTEEIPINSDHISVNHISGETHNTEYVLNKVMYQHFGMYDIIITNNKVQIELGVANFTIELDLKGKPQPPMNVNIVATSPTSFNITWEVGRDGGSTQEFIIEYSSNSIKQTTTKIKANTVGSKQSYELEGLLPNTKYNIRLLSVTDYQENSVSPSESIQAKTHAEPTNAAIIIGGVVGAFAVLAIIMAAIIVYLCWKKRTSSNKPKGVPRNPIVPAKVEKENSTSKDTRPLVLNRQTDNTGIDVYMVMSTDFELELLKCWR